MTIIEHPQQYLILGLLMMKEQHGYELHRMLSSGPGRAWYAGKSQTYALLTRLEAAGNIAGRRIPHPSKPPRNIYTITPNGRRAFNAWLSEPVQHIRDLRLEFMAKLFFFTGLEIPASEKLLARQRDVCLNKLAIARKQECAATDRFDHLLFRYRVRQIEGVISWLDDCISHFNNHDKEDRST